MTRHQVGDDPLVTRLNLRKELALLRRDPLGPVLDLLRDDEAIVLHHDAGRYVQAFEFFALSAEQCLRNISVGTRYHREVKPSLGGARCLTFRQRRLSSAFSARVRYFRLDLVNLLLHSRILLDRTVSFSRCFLTGPRLPSFVSFSENKKFFAKHPDAFKGIHDNYARHLAEHTSWFNMPVKAVRDKIVVHAGPPHFQFVTYPSDHDMGLFLVLDGRQPWTDYPHASTVRFSARRLIDNVLSFLNWYSEYATQALRGIGKT